VKVFVTYQTPSFLPSFLLHGWTAAEQGQRNGPTSDLWRGAKSSC
jgi:hypothetical protein